MRTLDYPYQREGRRRPDPLPKLIAAHRDALAAARAERDAPIVLAGKSMGGRVGCHVSLEEKVAALVCFGYPLQAAGKSGALRDKVLLDLRTPILFVQGTLDPLCPLHLLNDVRPRMAAPSELYVEEGGDHSLGVTRGRLAAAGQTRQSVDQGVLEAVSAFISKTLRASFG